MKRLLCCVPLALAGLFIQTGLRAATVPVAASPAPSGDTPPAAVTEQEVDIVIGGLPTRGSIVLPATDTNFKFRLKETGTVVDFKWTALEEYERKRVQKLYGMDVSDGKGARGETITGVRVKLKNNKTLEGLWIPDRDKPNYRALRTETVPLMLIEANDIVSEEPIQRSQGDFYSVRELYDLKILEKPPGPNDAGAHLAMAKWCASMGLYDKALEHLEQAKIIDPRTEERNADFKVDVVKSFTNQQSQELFNSMLRDIRAGKFLDALEDIQQLDKTFPNSDLHSRWDALRNNVESQSKTEINKKIVEMSYRMAMDMIQTAVFTKVRIDEKGNKVPTKPGKQVTTRQGSVFRGVLVSVGGVAVDSAQGDEYEKKDPTAKDPNAPATPAPAPAAATKAGGSPDDISLKMEDTTITIAAKDVLSIMDIDLAEGKGWAEPTYDELKEWVTDINSPTGLKMQMCRKISKVVKMSTDEVKKIFDNRLAKEGKYEDGRLEMTKNYANLHDASYDVGSWLRQGSKPMPYVKQVKNQSVNSGGGRYGNRGGTNNTNNNNRNNTNKNDPNAQQEEETAEETDDPNIWWKYQAKDLKVKVLRAIAGEKVFKPYSVNSVSCPYCSGKGTLGVAFGTGEQPQRCWGCRGITVLYKLMFH